VERKLKAYEEKKKEGGPGLQYTGKHDRHEGWKAREAKTGKARSNSLGAEPKKLENDEPWKSRNDKKNLLDEGGVGAGSWAPVYSIKRVPHETTEGERARAESWLIGWTVTSSGVRGATVSATLRLQRNGNYGRLGLTRRTRERKR